MGFTKVATSFAWEVSARGLTYTEWQARHEHTGDSPYSDIDGDTLNDLIEFALNGDPSSGDHTEVGIRLTAVGSQLDASYRRPSDLSGVVYQFEASEDLSHWFDVGGASVTSADSNLDEVRIEDVRYHTGITGDRGFIRLRIILEESGDMTWTTPMGWSDVDLHPGYQTHSLALVKSPLFVSRVASVSADQLATEAPGLTLIQSRAYYAEVIDGIFEGHRFDINVEASSDNTLALDHVSTHNTLTTLSSELVGAQVAVREHWTVEEVYQAGVFQASLDVSQADQIRFFNGISFNGLFLIDAPSTNPFWTAMGSATLKDTGNTVLAPDSGVFLNMHSPSPPTLTVTGSVRLNHFVRAVNPGYNLVGNPYPLPLSPVQSGLTVENRWVGSDDPAEADHIQIWYGDKDGSQEGYESYFLFDNESDSHWTPSDDNNLQDTDHFEIFPPNRAAFLKVSSESKRTFLIENPLD